MAHMGYEGLSYFSFFDHLRAKAGQASAAWEGAREVWIDSSEMVAELLSVVEGAYSAVKSVVEPWRLATLFGVVVLLYHFWLDVTSEEGSASPSSMTPNKPIAASSSP